MAKENVNELVDKLTLFDDDLMSRVFDNNIEATELMLRIIMGRNINVISVIGQDEIKSHEVGGRNITLDVHAIDVNGDEIDIEVQGNTGFAGNGSCAPHCSAARFSGCERPAAAGFPAQRSQCRGSFGGGSARAERSFSRSDKSRPPGTQPSGNRRRFPGCAVPAHRYRATLLCSGRDSDARCPTVQHRAA